MVGWGEEGLAEQERYIVSRPRDIDGIISFVDLV